MDSTIIERYIEIHREILSEFALDWGRKKSTTNFKEDVKSYYGFEMEFGWNILLNAFYVFEDTELAKKSFEKFSLQGPSRHKDVGERYLRLYGILNSIYQQKLAICNLIELHKIPNKKTIIEQLSRHPIIDLRHKIGSHASNYLDCRKAPSKQFDVYEISRADLERGQIKLKKNQNDQEYYDINTSLEEFNDLLELLLSQITKKIIKQLFKDQGKFFKEYLVVEALRTGNMDFLSDLSTNSN